MTEVDDQPRRRPRDRKERILELAAELFLARGFPVVTMEDIADATGVTPRALYRHYDNKSALLTQVIVTSQEQYFAARRQAGIGDGGRGRSFEADLPALIDVALATRALTVLWQREARYLPSDQRHEVRRRIVAIVEGIRTGIASEFPGLDRPRTDLRAWGVSSTLTSLGFHEQGSSTAGIVELLTRACRAAAQAPPTAEFAPGTPAPDAAAATSGSRLPRRERLLAAAAQAFARQGFLPVGIAEVARRAGIAGPGIYRYFPSKQSILDTLVRRLDEWRNLEHLRALRGQHSERELLRRLVSGHVAISVEYPDLVTLGLIDADHLSVETSEVVERNSSDREAAWVDGVRQVNTDLSKADARILVRAASAYLDDVARTPRLWRCDHAIDEIVAIAMAILTLGDP